MFEVCLLELEKDGELAEAVKQLHRSGVSSKDIIHAVMKILSEESYALPLSIFDQELGALESIVVYLHENCGLNYHQIGELLNRDPIAVGNSYRAARQKYQGKLSAESELSVPASLFKDRKTSVQRKLVRYLHDVCKLNFSEIARYLSRDPRTIWTAYHAGGSS